MLASAVGGVGGGSNDDGWGTGGVTTGGGYGGGDDDISRESSSSWYDGDDDDCLGYDGYDDDGCVPNKALGGIIGGVCGGIALLVVAAVLILRSRMRSSAVSRYGGLPQDAPPMNFDSGVLTNATHGTNDIYDDGQA